MNLRAAETTAPSPPATKRSMPGLVPIVIIVLVVAAAGVTGVAYVEGASGPSNYACMSVTNSSSTVSVTTTGLLHLVSNQYYVTCNEGSSLPATVFKSSCLTISPEAVPAKIGVGATTEYYYFSSSGGHVIQLTGGTLSNGGEIINPTGVSLNVAC